MGAICEMKEFPNLFDKPIFITLTKQQKLNAIFGTYYHRADLQKQKQPIFSSDKYPQQSSYL
jgi:hypothetical protein